MPGCILRVGGVSFDHHSFLETATLRPYKIWRTGEPLGSTGRRPGRVYQDNGFFCYVSQIDGDLSSQIKDAEAFLNTHYVDLQILTGLATVEECQLDFGYDCRIGEKVWVQNEYLPVSFLRLVGELKIAVALSLYPGRSLNDS